jgi:hypothetical protein
MSVPINVLRAALRVARMELALAEAEASDEGVAPKRVAKMAAAPAPAPAPKAATPKAPAPAPAPKAATPKAPAPKAAGNDWPTAGVAVGQSWVYSRTTGRKASRVLWLYTATKVDSRGKPLAWTKSRA